MTDNILQLFEGLSPDQAKELRKRIMPTLESLRREITTQPGNGNHNQQEQKTMSVLQLETNINPAVFEKLGSFPTWTPDDGPAPFVFADRPAGQRCAWSCHWSVANPNHKNSLIVTPADWGLADPGRMTPAQIEAELEDFIFATLLNTQHFHGTGQERMFSASLGLNVKLLNGANHFIQSLITDFRQDFGRNRSYASPYNPPKAGSIRQHIQRPGWFSE